MNEISLDINALEAKMLQHEQVPCPVAHYFGPGIYIREVTLPAGAVAIGHRQRCEHLNIMIKGRVEIIDDDGSVRELVAPLIYVGKPGRKVGRILDDTVWQNVYATTERDIDKLEATYLDKSPAWVANDQARQQVAALQREADREDYRRVIAEAGFTHALVRQQSENEADQIDMPAGVQVRVLPSPIEGRGLFLSTPVDAGEVIAPARIGGMRTPAGCFTNHSMSPNARMVLREGGDIDLVALRRIEGCRGGDPGEEVTIDYRQALGLSGITFEERPCLA